ncbi:MAG TPA: type IV secretory system conjugative DNA transfer family protein [Candidatus Saccharimonadales bacterium]|nr:type IV secretory system conjugative DNA transfer family protein [Candidatus Saccharimonadales bacterium]
MLSLIITVVVVAAVVAVVGSFFYVQYRKIMREAKNYERGLKMVPLLIHIPPLSDDIESGGRDERDITEESISQAQVMYNIITSTATKGFKSKIYGQRHLSLEIVSAKGLIHYYAVVPVVLVDVVKQAIAAAYPSARLEEVEEHNIFNEVSKLSGTIGGELTLKKDFSYPIATYQEAKRDAMRSILNALSAADREDGIGIQVLLRPAPEGWTRSVIASANKIRKDKGKSNSSGVAPKDLLQALWKAPEEQTAKAEDKQLTSLEQATVEAMEEKTRHPGYEVLIRVVASSNTASRSQVLLKNLVAAFSLFDSSGKNGFKFSAAKNMETFITSYIFRFFPQKVNRNILNSVELSTIFHLPDQKNIPTSQVERQGSKQVDGPHQLLDEGFLLGYNVYRGVKKEIRLSTEDRRRHTYIIGQTGTGKSGLLENLALQDMLDGKGFAFVDPHGDSADRLLAMVPKERVEDVIYFNPGDMDNPIGLNLFEFDTPDQRDFLVQEAIAMLYRLYDPGHTGIIGPRYEHWFRNAALTIMSDPAGSSFIDIPQVFNDNDFAKEKLKHVTDQAVLDFWNKEMAQTSDYHKSEVLGWFVSKFGAFLSNEMMRNIIGQTKSGFDLREIMDNKKILLVNLSKGRTGELNSQLLGMIFVMKFQAAAMGRANTPEDERVDFSLYVDEFQNFATDSFETILSEARKYRLNLILANQFMTQLTDKIREAIIGNVGTVISGRIGTTDAELMEKKFAPTFDAEDLTRLPNFETITSVMINNVPSSPFSMSLIPPLGRPNPKLYEALRRLSAVKYGRPRSNVEQAIFKRLRAGDEAREKKKQAMRANLQSGAAAAPKSSGSSFLDDWLAKRQQIKQARQKAPQAAPPIEKIKAVPKAEPAKPLTDPAKLNPTGEVEIKSADQANQPLEKPGDSTKVEQQLNAARQATPAAQTQKDSLKIKPSKSADEADDNEIDEIFIDLRGNLSHRKPEE